MASIKDEVNAMLAPVGGVTSTAPVNPAPFNQAAPVVNVDTQQLQLERQLQIYNQQLAVAQNAARQAEQLQRRITLVQQQIEQRQAESARAADAQADTAADNAAAEQLRTDNLLAEQQAAELRADDLAAERLADERLAADRLAADQLADTQNAAITEPQIRPPALDVSNLATAPDTAPNPLGAEAEQSNEDLLPPLTPDDSGRLINTLV
jgi:fused signal recognition particle receptor